METFPFRFDAMTRPFLLGLGVHPGNCRVDLTDDDRFVAKFGRWVVDTPIDNIDCVKLTGPYKRHRAIGLRGSFVDSGATFGSSIVGGVCVVFKDPVKGVIPGTKRHRGLTVTVGDREGLAAAIEDRR